jgi:hypothetical protein
MAISLLLLSLMIVALLAAVPAWPYSQDWGLLPTGAAGVALSVVIVLMLVGKL